jgi:hypothetical protein
LYKENADFDFENETGRTRTFQARARNNWSIANPFEQLTTAKRNWN